MTALDDSKSEVSREGYLHDFIKGTTTRGLRTNALKTSSTPRNIVYDAIVIGAGFTGLVAARDLALAGQRVLLLEARDRIGGRTWTAEVDGHNYEMGGTWVHWLQPHVWSEITRYGLVDGLKISTGFSDEAELSYLDDDRKSFVKQRPELIDERLLPLLAKFLDIDGEQGRKIFPEPWLPLKNSEVWREWDISLRQRADQLEISSQDKEFLLSWLAINTCSSAEQSSFLNLVRLIALSGHDFNLFMEICGRYKFKDGTTNLASAMLAEFQGDAVLNQAVRSITSTDEGGIEVVTRSSQTFRARQAICTIPLHCLSDVGFTPSLPSAFKTARHANFCGKVHLHSSTPVEPWCGMSDGTRYVIGAFTESPSTEGGTHVVSFSNAKHAKQSIESDPDAYFRALSQDLLPDSVKLEVTHLAWHDWTSDEFAKGAWASYGPGHLSASLGEIMKHDRISPNLLLASADWAHGWVGYIDGAIEMGRKAARDVALRLCSRS